MLLCYGHEAMLDAYRNFLPIHTYVWYVRRHFDIFPSTGVSSRA